MVRPSRFGRICWLDQLLIVKVPHNDNPADWLVDLLRELDPHPRPPPDEPHPTRSRDESCTYVCRNRRELRGGE